MSALFASDSDALVDEAFVRRCVTAFHRAQRRILVLQVVAICTAAGVLGLMWPSLTDSTVAISNWLSAEIGLSAIVPGWLAAELAALDSTVGGIDRAIAIAVVLAIVCRQYGLPWFRLRLRATRF